MVFVPLSAVAFATLPATMRAEAAGLFSLLRTMGGSVGISIVSVLLTRYGQVSWNQLGDSLIPIALPSPNICQQCILRPQALRLVAAGKFVDWTVTDDGIRGYILFYYMEFCSDGAIGLFAEEDKTPARQE